MKFAAPASLDEAVELLAKGPTPAYVLAGGTDLLVRMKTGFIEPELVVDIKRIPGLRDIVEEEGGYRIGAGVSSAEMNEHAGLMAAFPGVCEAAWLIGSTQIMGRATVTGNLCNASPAADSVPALVAVGAVARIVGPGGQRDLPVEEVPTGPGKTALAKGEFIASVLLPAKAAQSSDAYQRFIPRTEMDIAVVGAGVSVSLDEAGVCTAARVALGAVGPRVMLVEAAAQALIGTKGEEAALAALAAAASAAATPIDDKRGTKEFRTEVAGVIARRTAAVALKRAAG